MTTRDISTTLAKAVVSLLADGEWHDYQEIIRHLMPVIEPGPAFRHWQQDREKNRASQVRRGIRSPVWPQRPMTPEWRAQVIDTGRRMIITDFLRGLSFESQGRPVSAIRMVRTPALFLASPGGYDVFLDLSRTLRAENERLRDEVSLLRVELVKAGLGKQADRIKRMVEGG